MNVEQIKAMGDESRMGILRLLLSRNYCVGALAHQLQLTESAISQHIKVLREAGLVEGRRHGYFVHYQVKRDVLRQMAQELINLADIERLPCEPRRIGCVADRKAKCRCHRMENGDDGTSAQHQLSSNGEE